MLDFPSGLEAKLRPLVSDYKINLIQMAHLPKESRERLTSDFRLLAEYAAKQSDQRALKEWITRKDVEIQHPEEFLDTLSALTSDHRYKELAGLFQ